jgi:hypothetical protein
VAGNDAVMTLACEAPGKDAAKATFRPYTD